MKYFIPYEEALELKQLEFDEPCFRFQNNISHTIEEKGWLNWNEVEQFVSLPTFSQAFRFFREKYNLYGFPKTTFGSMNPKQIVFFYYWIKDGEEFTNIKEYSTYEEAELACLRKLIEIVKQK